MRKRFIPRRYVWPGIFAGLTIQVVSLGITFLGNFDGLWLNSCGLVIVTFFNYCGEKSE